MFVTEIEPYTTQTKVYLDLSVQSKVIATTSLVSIGYLGSSVNMNRKPNVQVLS